MLMVRVQVWPGGDEARAFDVATMRIVNVGGGLSQGTYEVETEGEATLAGELIAARKGMVHAHLRQRLPVWTLVSRALRSVGY